ncbi:MAG: 16S rRNA (cytosine(967)-C(5))-methyltransferase RsmB [Clostridia bacterium]|nr:16S rRNA (cytosine(967)-C(5))-methyltransferase RsmB [Clostridia bacterium]
MTAREVALKTLYIIEKDGAYCDKALKKQLNNDMSKEDVNLITNIVYGVTDKRRRLDYIIENYSTQKLNKISVFIKNILRMGIYQILFMDKIPHSAAVNESVKLAKRYGHGASAGFVNAILRNIIRNGDVTYPQDNISIFYSVPDWLTDLFESQYGSQDTIKIFDAFSKVSPTTIRVNKIKTSAEDLKASLENAGIKVNNTDYNDIFEISDFGDMAKINEYKEGLFTPQDISAYLTAETLNPQKGDFIIDVCAAPGGKTTHLAEIINNDGTIIAFDLYPHKVDIIESNCKRLGITCVNAKVWDSMKINEEYTGKADKVLADVPCSGLGVIGKKFDIKWHRSPEDIKEIIKMQDVILENASKYLKRGGELVYSTCTINKQENEDVVNRFIKNSGFKILHEKTIMPFDGSDGFYICKMTKE